MLISHLLIGRLCKTIRKCQVEIIQMRQETLEGNSMPVDSADTLGQKTLRHRQRTQARLGQDPNPLPETSLRFWNLAFYSVNHLQCKPTITHSPPLCPPRRGGEFPPCSRRG